VAYKTWGKLNAAGDNVMVICHALTGSSDVEDWWGPLIGPGRAFDPQRYFIFCGNVIGSPYGTVSSVTINPETGKKWGPEMPGSCVKDDVRLHKIVLDSLGVTSIAVVIGGSMGGMTTLEWPLNTPPGYVRHIVPLATSARYSAWGISWGEAQRQSIYSDPEYHDGYYCHEKEGECDDSEVPMEERKRRMEARQPTRGLAAARMAALLTYRSRDSFESRFGRKFGGSNSSAKQSSSANSGANTPTTPSSPREDALKAHNDGHRARKGSSTTVSTAIARESNSAANSTSSSPRASSIALPTVLDGAQAAGIPLTNLELSMPRGAVGAGPSETLVEAFEAGKLGVGASRQPQVFSAQSYLRYQGDKVC
jgi:homoserine O-acetyltransferase